MASSWPPSFTFGISNSQFWPSMHRHTITKSSAFSVIQMEAFDSSGNWSAYTTINFAPCKGVGNLVTVYVSQSRASRSSQVILNISPEHSLLLKMGDVPSGVDKVLWISAVNAGSSTYLFLRKLKVPVMASDGGGPLCIFPGASPGKARELPSDLYLL